MRLICRLPGRVVTNLAQRYCAYFASFLVLAILLAFFRRIMAAARKYGPPEPSVVDEALILTAVEDADRVSREYGEVTPNPALKIHEITKLALSFKSMTCAWSGGSVVIISRVRRPPFLRQPGLP